MRIVDYYNDGVVPDNRYQFQKLSNFKISPSINTLGNYSFLGCKFDNTVEIPATVINFFSSCFDQSSFNNLNLNLNSDCLYDTQAFLVQATGNKLTVHGKTNSTHAIISQCYFKEIDSQNYQNTSLQDGFFSNCSFTEKITLNKDITDLGYSTFYDCNSLKIINISDLTGISEYKDKCFMSCKLLNTITVMNNIEKIGVSCFEDCSGISYLEIPDSVTELGQDCFKFNSTNTVQVKFLSSVPPTLRLINSQDGLSPLSSNQKIEYLVPNGSQDAYTKAFDIDKNSSGIITEY